MSEVNRICPQCGGNVPLQTRYCGNCGCDTSSGLPVRQNNLPATVSKAALPVIAGLAGLALRSGWKLLQTQLTQLATRPQNLETRVQQNPTTQPPASRSQTVIRIRSKWAVGDARGNWKQGTEEHTIEIDN
jgi:hypothetical protein